MNRKEYVQLVIKMNTIQDLLNSIYENTSMEEILYSKSCISNARVKLDSIETKRLLGF